MALFPFLLLLARSFFAPRLELMAEILALRQQLAILNRTAKRPSLRFQDRLFWIALSQFWRDWRSALLIVKPETVIKCIVKGFGFIGAGSRKQVARDGQELMPKFANLSAGSHERILCGARHVSKPNSTCSGSRWLNQQLPIIESKHLSLPPKRGRLSSPIMLGRSSASYALLSPPGPSVTLPATSYTITSVVKSFISASLNSHPPPGRRIK